MDNSFITFKIEQKLLLWRLFSVFTLLPLSIYLYNEFEYQYNMTISIWAIYLTTLNSIFQLGNSILYRNFETEISGIFFHIIYKILLSLNFCIFWIFFIILVPFICMYQGGIAQILKNEKAIGIITKGVLLHSLPLFSNVIDFYYMRIKCSISDYKYCFYFLLLYLFCYFLAIYTEKYNLIYPLLSMQFPGLFIGIPLYIMITFVLHCIIVSVMNFVKRNCSEMGEMESYTQMKRES